ncbi:MAG: TRAP transporter large permease subunit [Nitrospinota bacterium]
MTETPYWRVALISLVPALLYYLSVFMLVHYYASRHNLHGLEKEELLDFWKILREDGILLMPVVILITLLIIQSSPFFAGFWSIVSAIVFSSIRRKCWYLLGIEAVVFVASAVYGGNMLYLYTALACLAAWRHDEARRIMTEISGAFVQGSVNSLVIGATAGVMGLVLTGVTHPDLAQKMTLIILSYSYGFIFLAVVLVALASYILGMGMTITASYILIIILAGPALQELGLSMLTSHMIVLWLSQDAALTPPFALGAFNAAGIAKCDPMETGWKIPQAGQAALRHTAPICLHAPPHGRALGAGHSCLGWARRLPLSAPRRSWRGISSGYSHGATGRCSPPPRWRSSGTASGSRPRGWP